MLPGSAIVFQPVDISAGLVLPIFDPDAFSRCHHSVTQCSSLGSLNPMLFTPQRTRFTKGEFLAFNALMDACVLAKLSFADPACHG